MKNWLKAVIAAAVVLILALIVSFTCVHKCDECGDTYFGKENKVTFFGAEESLCGECYDDFTFWN